MLLNLSKVKQIKILMSSSKDGAMVVLSSPSGAGKTTLVKKISKLNNFVIQYHIQQESQELRKKMVKIIIL